jgi:hypothetical protein
MVHEEIHGAILAGLPDARTRNNYINFKRLGIAPYTIGVLRTLRNLRNPGKRIVTREQITYLFDEGGATGRRAKPSK